MSLLSEQIGYSVYFSQFARQKEQLASLYRNGSSIFTSLHVSEEVDAAYVTGTKEMCAWLHDTGYTIVADVSKETLKVFGETDIVQFADRMHISILRIDCGFSVREIAEIAKRIPVCINASTVSAADAALIADHAVKVFALHNFYPRPETGLDPAFFEKRNAGLAQYGITAAAFIPGDILKRGPVFAGLPTLECHRNASPWAAFLDMKQTYHVDTIFAGDGVISPFESDCIDNYCRTGIADIPVQFTGSGTYLDGSIFTIRADSPSWLMRLEESRAYAVPGKEIQPEFCTERKRGSVTIDNIGYKRYSGEIQILKKDFPPDDKVNVIGCIPEKYGLLLDSIANGKKIRFISLKTEQNKT